MPTKIIKLDNRVFNQRRVLVFREDQIRFGHSLGHRRKSKTVQKVESGLAESPIMKEKEQRAEAGVALLRTKKAKEVDDEEEP